MIIRTVLGLITKWLLVQPIHNGLIDKCRREDLIFYKRNSICNLLDLQDFNILRFSVACYFFLLIFIIFSKRTSSMKNKLNGYVAAVVPVNIFIHVKRKFTAVIFAIIADERLRIVNQVINETSVKVDGVIVAYLLQTVEVFVIGVRFTIVNHSLCQSDFYPSDNDFNAANGTYMKRLFQYYVQSCILIVSLLDGLQTTLQALIDAVSSVGQDGSKQSEVLFPNLIRSFVIAILTACVIAVIQILVLLANIFRNFHFAAFFIAYLIWGYVLIALFTWIIYMAIDSSITYGSVRLIEKVLKLIIPVLLLLLLLLIFFKQYIDKILARFVFLQDYENILAIDNRRILMIFLYFNFFLDVFLVLISSIVSIIISIIGGILHMSRLDYSPMGRKVETFDAGFQAYCDSIHMEAAHRNPIMLTFSSSLYGCIKIKQHSVKHMIISTRANEELGKDYSSTAIKKLYLILILLRNPSLVVLRTHAFNRLKDKKNQNFK
ncbi:unnamed protein product [Rotaria socialis]|uniref:Receptor for retinol uptake STRA6 n=1 Tax=Rotaria socialis TaxID=392032 RepID=A0A818R9W7_9BILA|nr:unnamed protein product [Rotaria socialis]